MAYTARPEQPRENPARKWLRRSMWLTPICLVGACAAFGGAVLVALSSKNTAPSTGSQSNATGQQTQPDNANLSKDQLDAMTPEAVSQVPPSALLNAYGPNLEKWRQTAYELTLQNPGITADQKAVLGQRAPSGPKESYSDQDVLNQVALDVIDASTEADYGLGERELSLPYDKNLRAFSDVMREVQQNEATHTPLPVVDIFRPVGPSLPRPQGGFNGVDLSKYAQARLLHQEYVPSAHDSTAAFTEYGLYALVKDGQNQEWRLLRRWTTADSDFASSLTALMASGSPHQ